MKITLFIFILFLKDIPCKSQVIGSLEQFEECSRRPNHGQEGCPDLENITYVKDTNNRLNQFVGIWKGIYNGKQYEIHFEKQLQWGDDIKWDRVFGRMIIKDNFGNIIYNSLNKSLSETGLLRGGNFQHTGYVMHFVGNYKCLESGSVFIETSLHNPNEMKLFYSQDNDGIITSPSQCPNFETFVPLLPTEKMILTKQ
ncbi:DUF6705 family protein [Chryseobacterium herbae]|uniref:DUF6705 domain-containing protein n=1 Tax=Chryseobacterium herbae TaxID=2976476 RepID=A0ABT2J097_9FLAO|nr:hypothetical protein [Chryseobacterium sp. pc1-10]MCT2564275.1 hypothetical protein [Chryseobacterium sp. pc1-10]